MLDELEKCVNNLCIFEVDYRMYKKIYLGYIKAAGHIANTNNILAMVDMDRPLFFKILNKQDDADWSDWNLASKAALILTKGDTAKFAPDDLVTEYSMRCLIE